MAVLLAVGATRATAFKAFDCNKGSAPIEQYSLLDPEPCGNMQKVHVVERDLHGEIVQIKKERLVQVTKCIMFETITSTFCGFQSRAGVPRYVKFRTPLTIEPSNSRLSAKLGRIKINGIPLRWASRRTSALSRGRTGRPMELRGWRIQS